MAANDGISSLTYTSLLAIIAVLIGVPKLAGTRASSANAPDSAGTHALQALQRGADRAVSAGARGACAHRLIVTVPDPLDSRGDWTFDATLDAVRRAFERHGYVLQNHYLPWTDDAPATAGGRPERAHRVYPGWLLFRNTTPDSVRLWAVLLVGESPTAGVSEVPMAKALAANPSYCSGDVIRVVGPTYSGSAWSLHRLLNIHAQGRHAVIITGSATNDENAAYFTQPAKTYEFGSTVHSDRLLSAVRDQMLEVLGFGDRVALLVEGSTTYGQDLSRQAPHKHLTISVPLGIAGLRAEYQRTRHAESDGVPGQAPAPFELSLRDPASPLESPAALSGLTPPALEEMMDEIARTLKQRRIRAAGILVTDVRDKLFLATELRRRVPGIQLFTYESNALYLWPDFVGAMRGMLVITTYPLIAGAQGLLHGLPANGVVQFASEGAQGVFNATLLQLGDSAGLDTYDGVPDSGGVQRLPVWVTAVGRSGFVPLRVSASSDTVDAHYVVAPPLRTGVDATIKPLPWQEALPAYALAEALVVLAIVLAILPVTDRRLWKLRRRRADASVPPRSVHWAALQAHWHLYTAISALAALAVLEPTVAVVWARYPGSIRLWKFFVAVGTPLTLCALWAILNIVVLVRHNGFDALRFMFGLKKDAPRPRDRVVWLTENVVRTLVLFVSLWFAWQLLLLLNDIVRQPYASRLMFAHRVANFASGLSPLVPLAIGGLGLFFWAWWHLRRIGQLSTVTPFEAWGLESAGDDVTSAPAALPEGDSLRADCTDRIRHGLVQIRVYLFLLAQGWRSILMLALLAVLSAWLWFSVHAPLEAYAYPGTRLATSLTRLYKCVAAVNLACVLWGTYRLVTVWTSLRRLLSHMGATPLLAAFERLPVRVGVGAHLSLTSSGPSSDINAVAAMLWGQLQRLYGQLEYKDALLGISTTDNARGGYEATCAEVGDTAPTVEPVTLFEHARHARRFGCLMSLLNHVWQQEPTREDVASLAATLKGAGPTTATTGWFRQAPLDANRLWVRGIEEFVALHVVRYLEWVIGLLRRLALFLVLTLICATALITSNPAYDSRLIQTVFFIGLISTIGALILVLVQMNRDEVLSRINHTDPGKVTWDLRFLTNVVTLAGVPLVAVFAAIFPAIGDFLFSWVMPLLHAHAR